MGYGTVFIRPELTAGHAYRRRYSVKYGIDRDSSILWRYIFMLQSLSFSSSYFGLFIQRYLRPFQYFIWYCFRYSAFWSHLLPSYYKNIRFHHAHFLTPSYCPLFNMPFITIYTIRFHLIHSIYFIQFIREVSVLCAARIHATRPDTSSIPSHIPHARPA